MKLYFHLAISILAGFLAANADAKTVLNYQGRITSEGSGFFGTGQFKFVLMNQNGEGLWSNDGSSGTNQPSSWVSAPVNNGLFHVNLGDNPMRPIPGIALQAKRVYLRVWFSDGESGFEQLTPDTGINVLDLSQINTGRLLIVDGEGLGNFTTIQEAVDHAAKEGGAAILIMPGQYNETIRFPTNSFLTLRGAAPGGTVWIYSHETTLSFAQESHVHLENISISGSPALSDTSLPAGTPWSELTLRNCELSNPSEGSSGPVVRLEQSGTLTLMESAVYNHAQGPAVAISGDARLEARHSRFEAGSDPALTVSGQAQLTLESCALRSHSSLALSVAAANGYANFMTCSFDGGVAIANSNIGASFDNCELRGEGGTYRLHVVNHRQYLQLLNSRIHAQSGTAVRVEDMHGQVNLAGCHISAQDAPAIELAATSAWTGERMDLLVANSEVWGYGGASEPLSDAVVVSNASEGEGEVEFTASNSQINSHRRDAISAGRGCFIVLNKSSADGRRYGIHAPEGAEIEILSSHVWGKGGDAVHMGSPGFLFMRASEVMAEGDTGSGVYLNHEADGVALIFHSVIGSMSGPGLDATGGKVHCNHTVILSGADAMAKLAGADSDLHFNHCVFKSIAAFVGDGGAPHTSPAVLLAGEETPSPVFFACAFEPDGAADYSIKLNEAASGSIVLINSLLRKPVDSTITKNGADQHDGFGNAIFGGVPE